MSEPVWPDCGEVQCRQGHDALNAIMDLLGIQCDDGIYVIGKTVRIADEIRRLQSANESLKARITEAHKALSNMAYNPIPSLTTIRNLRDMLRS